MPLDLIDRVARRVKARSAAGTAWSRRSSRGSRRCDRWRPSSFRRDGRAATSRNPRSAWRASCRRRLHRSTRPLPVAPALPPPARARAAATRPALAPPEDPALPALPPVPPRRRSCRRRSLHRRCRPRRPPTFPAMPVRRRSVPGSAGRPPRRPGPPHRCPRRRRRCRPGAACTGGPLRRARSRVRRGCRSSRSRRSRPPRREQREPHQPWHPRINERRCHGTFIRRDLACARAHAEIDGGRALVADRRV